MFVISPDKRSELSNYHWTSPQLRSIGVPPLFPFPILFSLAKQNSSSAGPQFFISAEAPHYPTAFRAILVCYSLVVVSALALRFYLNCLNRKRDEKERVPAVENESGMANKINPTSGEEEEEELTDFHARGFRYRT